MGPHLGLEAAVAADQGCHGLSGWALILSKQCPELENHHCYTSVVFLQGAAAVLVCCWARPFRGARRIGWKSQPCSTTGARGAVGG